MNIGLDERLCAAATGTLELFGVYLGTRLGLYRALDEHGRLTAEALASAAGIHPRYAREWLEQQAVAGLVAVDDVGRSPDQRRYRLPAEAVGVLLDAQDLTHVAPFADMVVGIAQALDDVVAAYRSGEGVPYARYGAAFRRGQGGINRPAFASSLTGDWLPAIPGLVERLSRPAARIADVGSGLGWSTIALARAFPQAEVIGYDNDPESVADARGHAATAAVAARFVAADAVNVTADGPYDAVLFLETLHDLARPTEALAAARKSLAVGGSVVVVDERVAARFSAPGDELERMMYGWSITHCLPAAMCEQPSAALGTALRPDALRDLALAAGFATCDQIDVDAGFFAVYQLQG